jgi:hypothetical protein
VTAQLVVLGTVASNPYAGMAWMHMQIAAGLLRLGHDVYYLETTSTWPYDPVRERKVRDSEYAVPYLDRVCSFFGLDGRWAYRRSYLDNEWLGPAASRAEKLLDGADVVLNVAGSTRLSEDGLRAGRLAYLGTDPIYHEVTYANGHSETRAIIDEHADVVTYGENIGTANCPVPPLPRMQGWTRQPVLLDMWRDGAPARSVYTTVANWRQTGREVDFAGERYLWSKDVEFLRFRDLPRRANVALELATNLSPPGNRSIAEGEPVMAWGVEADAYQTMCAHGWRMVAAGNLTTNPSAYRDYIERSRGEFTVARDLHVRLQSGWFSERSACYLAAGRPVVTQDTGFGAVLPTGEGLFAFTTADEAVAALESIESDYRRHSRAARAIAEEYFRAETVLERLLDDLTVTDSSAGR